jgi:hypothetical protein
VGARPNRWVADAFLLPLPKLFELGRRRVLTRKTGGVRFRGLRLLWAALPLQFGLPQFRLIPCPTIRLATTIIPIEATGMFLASGAKTGRRVWGPKMSNADFRLSGSVRSNAGAEP